MHPPFHLAAGGGDPSVGNPATNDFPSVIVALRGRGKLSGADYSLFSTW
jgi:hypothetical protein